MTAVSRARLELLDRSLGKVEAAAEVAALREYRSWRAANLNAGIAEIKEHIKALAESALYTYGDAAGKLAADFYDEVAESAGADVPSAELPDIGDGALDAIDRRVRYLVGRLEDDGGREDI